MGNGRSWPYGHKDVRVDQNVHQVELAHGKSHCFAQCMGLAAPGLQATPGRGRSTPDPPQAEGSRHRRLLRWHVYACVCHLCHNSGSSQRRGPPPCRREANRGSGLRFAWNPPAIPSISRWRSPRQETQLRRSGNMPPLNRAWPWSSSLRVGRTSDGTPGSSPGGGRIALGAPNPLITRPPSRPKQSSLLQLLRAVGVRGMGHSPCAGPRT